MEEMKRPSTVALRELKSELSAQKDIFVTFASYCWLRAKTLTELRQSGVGGVGHACEMETSAMLVIAPGRVDMSLARKSGPGAALRYRVIDMQAKNPVALASRITWAAPWLAGWAFSNCGGSSLPRSPATVDIRGASTGPVLVCLLLANGAGER